MQRLEELTKNSQCTGVVGFKTTNYAAVMFLIISKETISSQKSSNDLAMAPHSKRIVLGCFLSLVKDMLGGTMAGRSHRGASWVSPSRKNSSTFFQCRLPSVRRETSVPTRCPLFVTEQKRWREYLGREVLLPGVHG